MLMTRSFGLAVASLAILSAAAPRLASARHAAAPHNYAEASSAGREAFNPNEGLQPNGCVKLCPLDTNPCDPPEFKRADGRCSLDR